MVKMALYHCMLGLPEASLPLLSPSSHTAREQRIKVPGSLGAVDFLGCRVRSNFGARHLQGKDVLLDVIPPVVIDPSLFDELLHRQHGYLEPQGRPGGKKTRVTQ